MDPTPFQVFCAYYLGLDREFRYRFFHLNAMAEHFGVAPPRLKALMDEWRLAPEDTRHVDYNLARAHATAQEIASQGQRDDVETFARRTWEEFLQARGGYDPRRDFENVDYDHILSHDEPGPGDPDD